MGLTKLGAGTLTLGAANAYTGVTTISAGTLGVSSINNGGVAGNLGAAPSAAANLVLNGGTLEYTGAGETTNRAFTINGTSTIQVDGSASLIFAPTGTNQFAGTGTLTMAGTGTLTMGSPNGATQAFTGLTVNSGGTVDLTSNNFLLNTMALTVNGTLNSANADGQICGTLNGSGTINFSNQALWVNGAGGTFSGTYNGTGAALDINSSSANMIMTGLNTYTGGTTLSSGVLSTGATGILANGGVASSIGQSNNGAGGLVFGGGTLKYANTGAAESTDRLFTITGGTTTSAIDASGTNSITFSNTGAVAFSGTNTTQTLTLTGTGVGVLDPVLGNNGTGATSLAKSGTGTWTVAGANTYTGATGITAGTLKAGSATALGNGAVTVTSPGTWTSTATA